MTNPWALVVAALIFAAALRALIVGAANASGDGITRSDEPVPYWLIIGGALAAIAFLIWKAFH